jgi:hypothetical protein
MNITWTEEQLKFLSDCADKRMSGSAIARTMTHKFKKEFTRNAVIGKAHRHKIPLYRTKSDPVVEKKITNAKRAIKELIERPKKIVKKPVIEKAEVIVVKGPFKNPLSKPTVLLDLVEGQCKYPEGDVRTNDLFFCGAPADSLRSRTYCAYCYPIMYQPLAKYRENKAK